MVHEIGVTELYPSSLMLVTLYESTNIAQSEVTPKNQKHINKKGLFIMDPFIKA